jgi:hypothetical protein
MQAEADVSTGGYRVAVEALNDVVMAPTVLGSILRAKPQAMIV